MTSKKSNSKAKAVLIITGGIACLILVFCVISHLTPLGMLQYLADYAAHHYFVVGFLCVLVALASWRLYTTLDHEIDLKHQKKQSSYREIKE
ncbi:hypothetical protein CNR22_02005 [Sphingobacteriaceae bacterium]|nr:hypothetical protein CNR22_02005 [Sphingobacteriaceae bacterium]